MKSTKHRSLKFSLTSYPSQNSHKNTLVSNNFNKKTYYYYIISEENSNFTNIIPKFNELAKVGKMEASLKL